MKKIILFLCVALLSSCLKEAIPLENMPLKEGWDYQKIPTSNFSLPLPPGARIEQNKDFQQRVEIIIDNLPKEQNWPGWTIIAIIKYDQTKYPSIDEYLKDLCSENSYWHKRSDAYRIKLRTTIEGNIDIYEIWKECSSNPKFYTDTLQTEFLIWDQKNVYLAYLGEEDDETDIELFRNSLLNLKITTNNE